MRALSCALLCFPIGLIAQVRGSENAQGAVSRQRFGHTTSVPSAMAVKKSSPIVLDAKLDDAIWATAQPITDFRQVDPEEGKPASQRT